jgi:hypothetical protein
VICIGFSQKDDGRPDIVRGIGTSQMLDSRNVDRILPRPPRRYKSVHQGSSRTDFEDFFLTAP